MPDYVPLQPVDYLVMGHIAQDLTRDGFRLGGTAAYSALTTRAIGLRVGVITSANEKTSKTSMKAFDGIPVISIPSEHSTTFENIYAESGRRQILHHQAEHISFELVPEVWRSASIIHLGPIAQELDSELPKKISPALLGVTPQGWMRTWNGDGRIVPCKWENAEPLLSQAGAVVISREDVSGDEELIKSMAHQTRILAVTEAEAGAVLYWNGDCRRFSRARSRGSGCDRRGRYFCIRIFHPFKSHTRSMGSSALCHTTCGAFCNSFWIRRNPNAA